MGNRGHEIKMRTLTRLLVYMLGHRPDEFGLFPDPEGYFPLKEILSALHEEPDHGYVREDHIREVLWGEGGKEMEESEGRLRARHPVWEIAPAAEAESVPRLLYLPIRSRAHTVVLERGAKTSGGLPLVLTRTREMALRIGKRRDPEPILLEILTERLHGGGFPLSFLGDLLSCSEVSPHAIVGPPLPKEAVEAAAAGRKRKQGPLPGPDTLPGTFLMTPSGDPDPGRRAPGQKPRGWKEQSRKMRRSKRT